MKAIKNLNIIALSIPLFISLFALFEKGIFVLALLSTMITGAIQILLAIKYWQEHPKNVLIKIYFLGVTLFFFLLYFYATNWIWCLPPLLCIYLSFLIHTNEIK
jgi:hypothetical protein